MNLLIINTHDTGIFTSVYGKNEMTPNILNFSKDATVYRNAFTVSPTCSPSRGAMLTGMYPTDNGLIGLTHRGFEIKDKSKHLANFLKSKGYETVLSGIQHENKFWLEPEPSHELGYEKVITDFSVHIGTGENSQDYIEFDKKNAISVVEYLKNRKADKPFYLSYGLFSTHRIYPNEITEVKGEVRLPERLENNVENIDDTKRLYTSLKNFDDNFELVISALKDSGEYDNTLIILTTDHGLANPFEKCNLECGGTQVSLIIRNPLSKSTHNKQVDSLISQIDVFPTICEILGETTPEYAEGKSFANCFDGEVNDYIFHEMNFHTSYEPARAVRDKDYVYIEYIDSYDGYNLSNIDNSPQKTALMSKLKIAKKPMIRLYDKKIDDMERNNVAEKEEYSSVVKKYSKILQDWRNSKGDRVLSLEDYAEKYRVNKVSCTVSKIKSEQDRVTIK